MTQAVGGRRRNRRSGLTRERILDGALRHFAKHGFHGAALRDISKTSRVRLSALHYHFGSKEDLIFAVFERLFTRLTATRVQRLQVLCQAQSSPTVEHIIDAFISPLLELAGEPDGLAYVRLQLRVLSESESLTLRLWRPLLLPATLPFIEALQQALPETPRNDIVRGYREMVWGVSNAPLDPLFELITGESALPSGRGREKLRQQLIAYHSAGLTALSGAR